MRFNDFKKIFSGRTLNGLIDYIKNNITDPRSTIKGRGRLKFELTTILFIAIIAKICGFFTYREIEIFPKLHKYFIKKYFKLDDYPSDDTYRLVLEKIDPDELFNLYLWITNQEDRVLQKKTHIAIDGKTPKGAKDENQKIIDIVSAYDTESKSVISQKKVSEKTNEISAIIDLLNDIKLKKKCVEPIITIDAIACYSNIINTIANNGWDYCIAFKGNQKKCYNQMYNFLTRHLQNFFAEEEDTTHGNYIVRRYYLFNDLSSFDNIDQFEGLKSIGAVISYGYRNGEEYADVRFFFTSLSDEKMFKYVVRAHWLIENNLHKDLDMLYGEDSSKIKKLNAPINFNIMRKIGLKFLDSAKQYLKDKNIPRTTILKCFCCNPDIISELLSGNEIDFLVQ